MTRVAEVRPLTANLEFASAGTTWERISTTDVPVKYAVATNNTGPAKIEISNAQLCAAGSTTSSAPNRYGDSLERLPRARQRLKFQDTPATDSRERFLVRQDWEGVVETIGSETFTARLRDRTNDESIAGEIAELPIADVDDDDRELLQIGGVFYLTVGRLLRANGRHERVGRMVFRRLPAWTKSTFDRAKLRAERLARFLAPKT